MIRLAAVMALTGLFLVSPLAPKAYPNGYSSAATTGAGCQFLSHPGDTAAFCDDFTEGPPSAGGRDAQLNPALWSVSRVGPGNPNLSADMYPWPSTPLSPCQTGVTTATADNDILVCDQASGHAGQIEQAFGAQNYAEMTMRARQPFDFASGGTITFNVDAVTMGGLSWWPTVWVTPKPWAGPTNAGQVMGLLPRRGIGFNFDDNVGGCDNSSPHVFTYTNYTETTVDNTGPAPCFTTQWGSLNHFEIQLSPTSVTVWASNFDGSDFQQIFTAPLALSFSTGYVSWGAGERAPLKYQTEFGITPTYANYYWSDLGFDGPVVNTGEVGYQAPDALTVDPPSGTFPGALNIGYWIDAATKPPTLVTCCDSNGNQTSQSHLTFAGVNLAGVKSAELTFDVSYVPGVGGYSGHPDLKYDLNGTGWRYPSPAPNAAAETYCTSCPGSPNGGFALAYAFPVPLSSLRSGTNTIMFTAPSGAPLLSNLDLDTFTSATAGEAGWG